MSAVTEGDVLAGKYRVERVLGEGGMGIVVAATHLVLDERVALKFMRQEASLRTDGASRFLREARAAVKLKSEHVARVLDVGTLDTGSPYIVMEYLDGEDLSSLFEARGPLPLDEVVDYILQACDAIAEAHGLGIIHRDLKPANLFVTRGRDGAALVKVLDFGISKVNVLGDAPGSMTSSEVMLGSPVYMAPEQMRSSRDVGPAADIWSLGIVLYQGVGGAVPFNEDTMGALMARVLTEPPPSLLRAAPHVPPQFVAVVERCLAKEPRQRYASVVELAHDLAPFGPTSSLGRVARITAMESSRAHLSRSVPTLTTAASAPGHEGPVSRGGPGSLEHPSLLGVAATQVMVDPSGERAAAARRTRRSFTYALAGVSALALTGAVVASTRSWRGPRDPASRVGADYSVAANPETKTAASLSAASSPRLSPPSAFASSTATSSTPTPAERPIPSAAPPARRATHASATTTAAPHAAPAPDPFGTNRQ